jgi:membrane-bound metal-dependent hydrolase YbcI (DUF457 family)
MASNQAHRATGVAAGLIAAAVITGAGAEGRFHVWAILGFAMGMAGSTAPDWLELAWWSKSRRLWITHRTLTHWGIAWVGLLVYSYLSLRAKPWAAPALGFACGGITHLLADWPNPLGVPWIYRRHSLNLWNSGRCDLVAVGAAWLVAAAVASHVWLHGSRGAWLLHYMRSGHGLA